MRAPTAEVDYGQAVAAEVRAMMARRNVAGKSLAARLGVSPMYVSRRMRGDVPWNVSELAEVARLLRCEVRDLLPATAATHEYPRSRHLRLVPPIPLTQTG